MSIFHDNAVVGSSGQQGYKIERSLRFNSADSANLDRAFSVAGNRRTWTWSGWVKRCSFGADQTLFTNNEVSNFSALRFRSSEKIEFAIGEGSNVIAQTTGLFRDPSAWYHIIFVCDTTNANSSDRMIVYVNNTRQTLNSVSNYPPSQNYDGGINRALTHRIGRSSAYGDNLGAYMTEVYFIDGQALTPSSFGETDIITGVWKPKKYAGTYSGNSFYLKFADNSGTTSTTLGKDSSGLGNNFTPNNFSVTAGAGNDSMIDTPTPYADGSNGRGNYATWNPLGGRSGITLSDGNLRAVTASQDSVLSTIGMSSGKWYAEFLCEDAANSRNIGLVNAAHNTDVWVGNTTNSIGYNGNGSIYVNNSIVVTYASYTTTDIIGVAFNADAGTVTFYKNGALQGTPSTSLTSYPYFFAASDGTGTAPTWVANFGQRPFAYTPPSGFLALNTQNLPEPSIKKPSSYFDTLLYTGNATARSITGLGFSPDFVWTKVRSSANDHKLYDAVRGATKVLESSNTGAEGTDTQGLTAFNSDGFSLGTAASSNANGSTYVAWCWDESATPGFDIVSFASGTAGDKTFAHSLGVAPSFMIVKSRDESTYNWGIYHSTVCTNQQFFRFTTDARVSPGYNVWGTAIPTSSVFGVSVSDSQGIVKTNQNCIAYLWSEVAGFSKFGSYTGNGSSDGPFVFCGFRPKWILFKNSTTGVNSWHLYDTLRSSSGGNNTLDYLLLPNNNSAEEQNLGSTPYVDALSNGFKIRRTGGGANGNGDTYIFAAFAESPFKYSLAR